MAVALKSNKMKKGRVPTKRSINLAGAGQKPMNLLVAIPGIVLILVAAALFSKFAVVDRLAEVSRAQAETAAVRNQVNACYQRIDEFGEIAELYGHYTYSGMTAQELLRADRPKVLNLIRRLVMDQASLNSWTLGGNILTLNLSGGTLQEMSNIVQQLENDELVNFCTVTTASTNQTVTSSEDVKNDLYVNAVILVYLNDNDQEGLK